MITARVIAQTLFGLDAQNVPIMIYVFSAFPRVSRLVRMSPGTTT